MSIWTPLVIITLTLLVLCMGIVAYLTKSATNKLAEHDDDAYEHRKVFFAAAILTGLGTIFLEGMFLYYFSSDASSATKGKDIFDGCKTIVPPLVALVIGYYFGSKGSARHSK